MFTCRLNPIALLVIVLLVSGCAAQPSNTTITTQCEDPPPTDSFTCNNISGLWEIESLVAGAGDKVIFASPAVIYGNLTLGSGATVIFRDYNSTYVHGTAFIASSIILDFGASSDDGLFYEYNSLNLKSMPLIWGQEPFYVHGTTFEIRYTGGCTKLSGALGVSYSTEGFPYLFHVSHISKSGTGNCHWIWSLLSFLSTMVVMITVPLIEKYAWKVYD